MIRLGTMSRANLTAAAAWRAVEAIRAESTRLGIPALFRTDLDHDQRAILARAGGDDAARSFGWALHEHGTHLAHAVEDRPADRGAASRNPPHSYMRAVASAWGRDLVIRWYLYTPALGLVPVASAEDLDLALAEIAGARWRCLTCTREGSGDAPARCPGGTSEHDANHGPHAVEVRS